MAGYPLTIGAATRPHPHETANGDAWVAAWPGPGICQIAVIDGLGHGPAAAEASAAALAALAAAPTLDPVAALHACHRALVGTRGAAIAIVRLDLQARQLIHAGAGNVEPRLWRPERERRLSSQRGIVGANIPTLRAETLPLEPAWCLILHTDGISARFALADFPPFPDLTPQALAEAILARQGRATDDATIVVARPAVPCSRRPGHKGGGRDHHDPAPALATCDV